MSQSVFWPSSAAASNPSTGLNGSTSPGSSTLVAGQNPSGNTSPIQLDGSGNLKVTGTSAVTGTVAISQATPGTSNGVVVNSSALPSGASTSALQSSGNTSLASIDSKTATLVAGRVPVDGSGVTQPVSAASLPLPTGASTSALQGTANTSLASIVTNTTGLATSANQGATQGSATGGTAASKSDLVGGTFNTSLPSLSNGQQASLQQDASGRLLTSTTDAVATGNLTAAGQAVTLSVPPGSSSWSIQLGGTFSSTSTVVWEVSDDGTTWVGVNGRKTGTGNGASILATSAVGPGPQTYRGNLASLALFRVRCSVYNAGDSISVTIKSATGVGAVFLNSAIPGGINNIGYVSAAGTIIANAPIQNVYSTTNITTSAYTQLIASTANSFNNVHIFDSSGQAMIFAVGGAGSEVIQLYVPPGGDTYAINIPAGSRIAYKALTANATSGYLLMSFLQ